MQRPCAFYNRACRVGGDGCAGVRMRIDCPRGPIPCPYRSKDVGGMCRVLRPALDRGNCRSLPRDVTAAGAVRCDHDARPDGRHDGAAVQTAVDVGACRQSSNWRPGTGLHPAAAPRGARRHVVRGISSEAGRPDLRKLHVTAVSFGSSRTESAVQPIPRSGGLLRRVHPGSASRGPLAGFLQCQGGSPVRVSKNR